MFWWHNQQTYIYNFAKEERDVSNSCLPAQVETIGDAYMVVSGVREIISNHAEKVCDFSLDMVGAAASVFSPATGKPIQVGKWYQCCLKMLVSYICHCHVMELETTATTQPQSGRINFDKYGTQIS